MIVPIEINRSKREPSNYEPKYHTPVPLRIMKGMIKSDKPTYLIDHGLINSGQTGFLSNKACSTYMTDVLNTVTKAAKDEKLVIVTFLNMTKAFDRVSA